MKCAQDGSRPPNQLEAITIGLCVILISSLSCTSEQVGPANGGLGSRGTSGEQTKSSQTTGSNDKNFSRISLETLAEQNSLFHWSLDMDSTKAGNLYTANAEDFKLPYANDKANQGKQGWDEYAEFIPNFYNGTFYATGWNANAKERIGDLKSVAVNKHFNVIGRVIAAEWAKDNSVRKISTSDLLEFSNLLTATATEKNLLKKLRELGVIVQEKLDK